MDLEPGEIPSSPRETSVPFGSEKGESHFMTTDIHHERDWEDQWNQNSNLLTTHDNHFSWRYDQNQQPSQYSNPFHRESWGYSSSYPPKQPHEWSWNTNTHRPMGWRRQRFPGRRYTAMNAPYVIDPPTGTKEDFRPTESLSSIAHEYSGNGPPKDRIYPDSFKVSNESNFFIPNQAISTESKKESISHVPPPTKYLGTETIHSHDQDAGTSDFGKPFGSLSSLPEYTQIPDVESLGSKSSSVSGEPILRSSAIELGRALLAETKIRKSSSRARSEPSNIASIPADRTFLDTATHFQERGIDQHHTPLQHTMEKGTQEWGAEFLHLLNKDVHCKMETLSPVNSILKSRLNDDHSMILTPTLPSPPIDKKFAEQTTLSIQEPLLKKPLGLNPPLQEDADEEPDMDVPDDDRLSFFIVQKEYQSVQPIQPDASLKPSVLQNLSGSHQFFRPVSNELNSSRNMNVLPTLLVDKDEFHVNIHKDIDSMSCTIQTGQSTRDHVCLPSFRLEEMEEEKKLPSTLWFAKKNYALSTDALESFISRIYRQNHLIAQESNASVKHLVMSCESVDRNSLEFDMQINISAVLSERSRRKISEYVRMKKKRTTERELELAEQYENRLHVWRKRMRLMERKVFNKLPTTSEDILVRVGLLSRRSTCGEFIRSEEDILRIMWISERENRPKQEAAVIPAMNLDEDERSTMMFNDTSGQIVNMEERLQRRHRTRPWTEEETHMFLQAFHRNRKCFDRIVELLPQRSLDECVDFYYRYKRHLALSKKPSFISNGNLITSHSLRRRKLSTFTTDPNSSCTVNMVSPLNVYESNGLNKSSLSSGKMILPSFSSDITNILRSQKMSIQSNTCGVKDHRMRISTESDAMTSADAAEMSNRWTKAEKERAIRAIELHGKNFVAMARYVRTRNECQCRYFFQNYRQRLNLDSIVQKRLRRKNAMVHENRSLSDHVPRKPTSDQGERVKFLTDKDTFESSRVSFKPYSTNYKAESNGDVNIVRKRRSTLSSNEKPERKASRSAHVTSKRDESDERGNQPNEVVSDLSARKIHDQTRLRGRNSTFPPDKNGPKEKKTRARKKKSRLPYALDGENGQTPAKSSYLNDSNIVQNVVLGDTQEVVSEQALCGMPIDIPDGKRNSRKKRMRTVIGAWSEEEHVRFVDCLKRFGRDWSKFLVHLPHRSVAQIRKYYKEMKSKLDWSDLKIPRVSRTTKKSLDSDNASFLSSNSLHPFSRPNYDPLELPFASYKQSLDFSGEAIEPYSESIVDHSAETLSSSFATCRNHPADAAGSSLFALPPPQGHIFPDYETVAHELRLQRLQLSTFPMMNRSEDGFSKKRSREGTRSSTPVPDPSVNNASVALTANQTINDPLSRRISGIRPFSTNGFDAIMPGMDEGSVSIPAYGMAATSIPTIPKSSASIFAESTFHERSLQHSMMALEGQSNPGVYPSEYVSLSSTLLSPEAYIVSTPCLEHDVDRSLGMDAPPSYLASDTTQEADYPQNVARMNESSSTEDDCTLNDDYLEERIQSQSISFDSKPPVFSSLCPEIIPISVSVPLSISQNTGQGTDEKNTLRTEYALMIPQTLQPVQEVRFEGIIASSMETAESLRPLITRGSNKTAENSELAETTCQESTDS